MKHVTLFFCTCLFVLFSCSKPVEVVEETYEDGTPRVIRTYEEKNDRKILISEKVMYPNGKLQIEGTYKENKRHGTWAFYYENGNKWSEAVYEDGQYNGKSTTWFENGNLRYEGFYKKGIKSGTWKFYTEAGELEKEVQF